MSFNELLNRINTTEQNQEDDSVTLIDDELLNEIAGGSVWGQVTWNKAFW